MGKQLLGAVSVEVYDGDYLHFLHYFPDFAFDIKYFRGFSAVLLVPAAIEVESSQVASIVADSHSIYVHHWEDKKLKLVQQKRDLLPGS